MKRLCILLALAGLLATCYHAAARLLPEAAPPGPALSAEAAAAIAAAAVADARTLARAQWAPWRPPPSPSQVDALIRSLTRSYGYPPGSAAHARYAESFGPAYLEAWAKLAHAGEAGL